METLRKLPFIIQFGIMIALIAAFCFFAAACDSGIMPTLLYTVFVGAVAFILSVCSLVIIRVVTPKVFSKVKDFSLTYEDTDLDTGTQVVEKHDNLF